jgi:hypothetical protein
VSDSGRVSGEFEAATTPRAAGAVQEAGANVQTARTIRCDRLPRRGVAGGPNGSLAPADPSSVAEGNPLRCLASPALLRFARSSTAGMIAEATIA